MKRTRSPPCPPFVEHYAPYTGGQLRRACVERNCANHKQHWDVYYRSNTINGYKDRHYILREFVELRTAIERARSDEAAGEGGDSSFAWMEAGCGVGNAMLPILEAHGDLPQWRALLGFDISSVAIRLLEAKVQALPPALAAKVHVCVLDPCEHDVAACPLFRSDEATTTADAPGPATAPPPRVPQAKVEFVSMVFVLCSIPVDKHALVLRRIAACMTTTQPAGVFFFRDYCVSDHAETRFRQRDERVGRLTTADRADSSTFTRTNGTLSHFFSVDEVRALFTSAGFAVIDLKEVEREVHNRKTERSLSRKFVQGRFQLTTPPPL